MQIAALVAAEKIVSVANTTMTDRNGLRRKRCLHSGMIHHSQMSFVRLVMMIKNGKSKRSERRRNPLQNIDLLDEAYSNIEEVVSMIKDVIGN